ncbi:MAG: hypothetical protein J7L92_02290 [Dehalococcoidia bacterium]|nr:hypothetical protein [Dehalococcoidia bacterium]RLC64793.1 MAG: hypothetical protein DRI01_02750 [Chloroflexota bacterium]
MKTVIFSSFDKLIEKLWLLMPRRKTYDVSQRRLKANKIREYYYIKYTTSALRVIAWVILVLGCIGSLVWGIIMGGVEGGLWIVLGIIGSFLAWLLLLAARELIKLFLDVKANTRSAADYIAKDSG